LRHDTSAIPRSLSAVPAKLSVLSVVSIEEALVGLVNARLTPALEAESAVSSFHSEPESGKQALSDSERIPISAKHAAFRYVTIAAQLPGWQANPYYETQILLQRKPLTGARANQGKNCSCFP